MRFPIFYGAPESLDDTDGEIAGNFSQSFHLIRQEKIQPTRQRVVRSYISLLVMWWGKG